jgi:hypothetical protein
LMLSPLKAKLRANRRKAWIEFRKQLKILKERCKLQKNKSSKSTN